MISMQYMNRGNIRDTFSPLPYKTRSLPLPYISFTPIDLVSANGFGAENAKKNKQKVRLRLPYCVVSWYHI